MTAAFEQVILATPGEKTSPGPSIRKAGTANPQQGMVEPATSVSANTAATVTNTACTSPLTITSLEAAAAATAAANAGISDGVPQVVPVAKPEPLVPNANVEQMLMAPMAKLDLRPAPPPPPAMVHNHPHPPPPSIEDKKMRIRTPPTEHDNRKLFVGGLPTDVTDHGFLEFFKQFGDVIDSVVMVDRLTKRSRGFGFVTFASEADANSLLTSIPGKTGYVVINGKQCEVKASTPKVDDGSGGKHAPGMWRSNPPRHDNHHHHRGHGHHQGAHNNMKMHRNHHQPRGQKQFYIDNEFIGDVDGRNFDEVQYGAQAQMNTSYQPMNVYGRNLSTSNASMYQQNYQNVYSAPVPSNGYGYPNNSAASVPSSWDASYPASAPSQYGQYSPNTMSGGSGYYDPYAHQYANQYGNNSMPSQLMAGQAGYTNYGGYYAQPMQAAQGMAASVDSGFEPYPQSQPGGDGDWSQGEQYE